MIRKSDKMYQESECVELKSEVIPDLCKEVIAFANSRGGTIYIGVYDDGTIKGVEDTDKTILQMNHMIRDTIKPDITMYISYEVIVQDNKKIIAVHIQKGTSRPYYLGNKGLKSNGVYVRNGTSCDQASESAIRKMIKECDGESYELIRSLHQDLTFEYTKKQFEKRNVSFDIKKLQTLGLLSYDGVYSNVGLLLSDQCQHTIKAATFSGVNRLNFHDRKEFKGSLFEQMEEVYAYLDMRNKIRSTFDGLYRIDIYDYPQDALREALMNAIVHRDYSYSASTLISVYDNRIEFVSIGGLFSDIELEDVMLGISVCRNEKLASIFYRLKLIEAYGTGMQKMMDAYADCEVKPEIEVTKNAFKITLPNRNEAKTTKYNAVDDEETKDEKMFAFLRRNKYITRKDVEKILGVSQATAVRILKAMVKKELLIQSGNGKNIKYYRK